MSHLGKEKSISRYVSVHVYIYTQVWKDQQNVNHDHFWVVGIGTVLIFFFILFYILSFLFLNHCATVLESEKFILNQLEGA